MAGLYFVQGSSLLSLIFVGLLLFKNTFSDQTTICLLPPYQDNQTGNNFYYDFTDLTLTLLGLRFQDYYECPGPEDPLDHVYCCQGSCCNSRKPKPKLKPTNPPINIKQTHTRCELPDIHDNTKDKIVQVIFTKYFSCINTDHY